MKFDRPIGKARQPEPWVATFMVLDVSSTITSSQWRRIVAWVTGLLGRMPR